MTDKITDAQYRAADGVNWSRLKIIRESPLHYQMKPDRPDTAALGMLRAVHAIVLEPENFDQDFAVFEGRRDKRSRSYQEFLEEHEGKTILNPKELHEATQIASAVCLNRHAEKLLEHENAETEIALFWQDPPTGINCKAKIDLAIIEDGKATLIDLKTVQTLEPKQIARDVVKWGYHGQLAHYAEALKHARGVEVVAVGLLCVEGTAPHDVGLFIFDDEAREAGQALRDRCLSLLADCERENHWPGRCPNPQPLTLPGWALENS
jgi:exodeoxyribonuclease VIII